MQTRTRLVIIGNGMVGHKLIETLVASAAAHQFELVTSCEEPRYAYDRVHLSEFFKRQERARSVAPRISIHATGVTVHLNDIFPLNEKGLLKFLFSYVGICR